MTVKSFCVNTWQTLTEVSHHLGGVVKSSAGICFIKSKTFQDCTVRLAKTKPHQCCCVLTFRWCCQRKWTSWWSGPAKDPWSEWTGTNSGASSRLLPGTTQWLSCSLPFSPTDSVLCASMSSFGPKLQPESHLVLCRELNLRAGLNFDTCGRNIHGQVTAGLSLQFSVWEYVCNVFVRKQHKPWFYLSPKIIPAVQKQCLLWRKTQWKLSFPGMSCCL